MGTTITIIGAGAWGTALASLASRNGHEVRLWERRSPEKLEVAIANASIIVSAVSMSGVRSIITQLERAINYNTYNTIIVTATKGLDPVTTCTPSQIWQTAFPRLPVVVLSGPNLSKEIQEGLPAATVAASTNLGAAEAVQAVFNSAQFRVYTNADPLGVELGGTLKNIMALAAGTCDGLQLGTNAKAALLTRGLAEIIRIGKHWGAKPETFYGLSGLGDLLATCNSSLSRNYQVGVGLAMGNSLYDVLAKISGTAEGVNTTRVLIERLREVARTTKQASEHQLEISVPLSYPISYQVYRLLEGEISPQAAVEALMLRDTKPE